MCVICTAALDFSSWDTYICEHDIMFFLYIVTDLHSRTGFFIDVHEFSRSVFLHSRLSNVRPDDSAIQKTQHQMDSYAYGIRVQILEVYAHYYVQGVSG